MTIRAFAPARGACSRPTATRWSARLRTAASAIDAVRELQPDVVLLDIRLPDLDGFQVAERLAANGASPAIVLTSSRDRSDFGYEIDACPAHGFIPKSELSAEAITLLIG